MVLFAAPEDTGLVVFLTLLEDFLDLVPCISVDDGLMVIRQVVRMVLPVGVRLFRNVVHWGILLKELVPDISFIRQHVSDGFY